MNDMSDDDAKAKISVEETQKDSEQGTTEGTEKEKDMMEELPPLGTKERTIAEKRLVKKLDMRLLPTIFLIYIMNYIDVCALPVSTPISGPCLTTLAERNYHRKVEGDARRLRNKRYDYGNLATSG